MMDPSEDEGRVIDIKSGDYRLERDEFGQRDIYVEVSQGLVRIFATEDALCAEILPNVKEVSAVDPVAMTSASWADLSAEVEAFEEARAS